MVCAYVPSTYFFSSPNYVLLYFQGMFLNPHIFRCCYITMDFAMAATKQSLHTETQQMCHITMLFHNCSMIKDESDKKCKVFVIF